LHIEPLWFKIRKQWLADDCMRKILSSAALASALLCECATRSCAGETVLTNVPPGVSIVRFETARLPFKGAVWRQMPRADGEYALSATRDLQEWHPKWDGKGTPGCILDPPLDFSVRAVTRHGAHYYLDFTSFGRLVWIGNRLLEVPPSTSTHIVQKVERVLKKK
jgi:hypothetical protein